MATPVEEIKSRIDVVELINEYVPLKPAGTSYKARCPFHNERTPSFMVSRERGTWHCFGCARGGDIFSFVQEMENLDFPETLQLLAKRAGVTLSHYDPKQQTQKTRLLDVLRWTNRYWQEVLHKSSDAETARQYLQKRGLDQEALDAFGIGLAPAGWDPTYQALKQKGFPDDDIFQAGLTIRKTKGIGWLDRFAGRIMFPIADQHGTVVGFSGRIMDSAVTPDRPQAKYVNSPQTAVYNKSAILYGLDKAKQSIKKADRAVLVEGYMDCIASHQSGVTNVVAVSGTALTADQVRLAKRFTSNVVLAFDQDAAGTEAARRGVEQALAHDLNVMILTLPSGKDPDELIRRDAPAWRQAIAQAQPILEYFFQRAQDGRDLQQVRDKKLVARELLHWIAKIADPVEQTHYLQKLADLLRVEEGILRKSLPTSVANPGTTHYAAIPAGQTAALKVGAGEPPADRHRQLSTRFTALLMYRPVLISQATANIEPEALSGADLVELYTNLIVCYTQQHLATRQEVTDSLVKALPSQRELIGLLSLLADREFSEIADQDIERDLLSMLTALKRHYYSTQLQSIATDLRRLERAQAPASDMTQLIDQFQTVTAHLRDLPKE